MVTSPNLYRNSTRDARIVGIDDGAFPPNKRPKQQTIIVAVLFQNLSIRAVKVGRIHIDGTDANRVLVSLLRTVRYDGLMLSGISFGGFNLVNITKLAHTIRKPVIAISGEKPDNDAVRRALRGHFADWKGRWRTVQAAGKLHSFKPLHQEPRLYFEVKGASPAFARKMIASTAVISRLPEPVRVARILARGLSPLLAPKFLES